MRLNSKDELTELIVSKKIQTWEDLKAYVRDLPYGKNKNRSDFSLVIKENKGTCSSKHALLKQVADLNGIPDIELILCLYKMNTTNTPGIGIVPDEHNLAYIPEAHCFMLEEGIPADLTNADATMSRFENDIIEEISIAPYEVVEFKINYHKDYLMQWLVKERIPLSFDQIWSIREQCISNLEVQS